jgi:hypothetical protein
MLCGLRHSITELYATVYKYFQAMEAMTQHMENLERVVEPERGGSCSVLVFAKPTETL